MNGIEALLEEAKAEIESSLGWGVSSMWSNQDFIILSEKIQEQTGVSLSHVTLKRLWGKVKYDSMPNTHTLDTLVQFIGYENWRAYKSKHKTEEFEVEKPRVTININESTALPETKKVYIPYFKIAIAGFIVLIALTSIYYFLPKKEITVNTDDYSFSSTTVVTENVPNSVVFDFDATKSPYDSVIIQQSWNADLQTKLPKSQRKHTSIYYYPNNFRAKLIVGNQIVKEHNLLIKTKSWLPLIEHSPVPVYFKKEEVIANGKMSLRVDQIKAQNIDMKPKPPRVSYSNVQDFGEIYTDDFIFETSLKNDYKDGASVCQYAYVYLQCVGNIIWVPLSAKGCISDIDLAFTKLYQSGKKEDLSAFGVDFSKFVKMRVESKNGKAAIYINDKLAYTIKKDIDKAKIIGITFRFQGTGTVDYVKLLNDQIRFEDNF